MYKNNQLFWYPFNCGECTVYSHVVVIQFNGMESAVALLSIDSSIRNPIKSGKTVPLDLKIVVMTTHLYI